MFVRGGGVDPGDVLVGAGYGGLYWSSVSFDSNTAYALAFIPDEASPSDSNSRYLGFSVRCVALGG